ncbi:hypothetical protein ACRRTK_019614 [Alexandromys fortis]
MGTAEEPLLPYFLTAAGHSRQAGAAASPGCEDPSHTPLLAAPPPLRLQLLVNGVKSVFLVFVLLKHPERNTHYSVLKV